MNSLRRTTSFLTRALPLLAFVLSAHAALAQADLWSHVRTQPAVQQLQPASLSKTQLQSLANLIRQQKPADIWECDAAGVDDLIQGIRFQSIPVAPHQNVVLAEAPAGCARGGQGSNGAMWLIRFDGQKPTLLATPKEFSGWLLSVQPSSSHGYADVVLGWHMSAAEANLSYFRFDGKSYHNISSATLESDEEGGSKVVPHPK
jgi:hypothetical protein